MSWWVLIWMMLVVIAAAYLLNRGWAVWGQLKELNAEIRRASGVLSALETQTERLRDRPPPTDLAIFGDPVKLRRERLAIRGALREQRHARRAARLPRWARRLD